MERLSVNPYSIKRLNRKTDKLAFTVASATAISVTGVTQAALFASGSLFYAE